MVKYLLVRESDNAGDSGLLCEILDWESYKPIPGETYPRVGCGVRVGSPYARTYSMQDWWQTTPIVEILEESVDKDGLRTCRFKTANSIYKWMEF